MEHPLLYFCVKCERLKEIEQAVVLFRTGFYRVQYPLGCCARCKPSECIV